MPAPGGAGLVRQVWWIIAKDVRLEARSKGLLPTLGFFTFLITVVFHFAFDFTRVPFDELGAGLLWTVVCFAGIIALEHGFRVEREGDAITALRLSPVHPVAVYLAKLLVNCGFLLLCEALCLGLLGLFFRFSFLPVLPGLAVVLVLNTLGYAAVGTPVALIASYTRRAQVVLTVLQLPVLIPLLLAAVRATGTLLQGGTLGEAGRYLKVSGAFVIIFLTVSVLIFEQILTDRS